MTPCTCDRDMGDHCAKCAPTVETGREGWPVLFAGPDDGEWCWEMRDGLVGDLAISVSATAPGKWLAYPPRTAWPLHEHFDTPALAAEALHARLPDEAPAVKWTSGVPLDMRPPEAPTMDTRSAAVIRRTPSPTLLDILDLLDMAGKDHPAVAKLAAMARREIVS